MSIDNKTTLCYIRICLYNLMVDICILHSSELAVQCTEQDRFRINWLRMNTKL